MIFIALLFNIILNFQPTKMILGFNSFSIFILFILIYANLYTKFSLNLIYNISQHKCFFLWLFKCFYLCQVFKVTWIINQTDSTFTFRFLILIILFCIKCLPLPRLKAKCYIYFISLEFRELIGENCDEFLSFISNALFYIVILMYFSLLYNFFTYFQFHMCLL